MTVAAADRNERRRIKAHLNFQRRAHAVKGKKGDASHLDPQYGKNQGLYRWRRQVGCDKKRQIKSKKKEPRQGENRSSSKTACMLSHFQAYLRKQKVSSAQAGSAAQNGKARSLKSRRYLGSQLNDDPWRAKYVKTAVPDRGKVRDQRISYGQGSLNRRNNAGKNEIFEGGYN